MKSWNSFSQELTEKKAKKDYDGDGKIESGSKEHAGVVHNAIQRAKGKKADGQDTRKEELEIEEGYDEPKMHSAVKRVMTTQPAAKGRAASRLHSKYSMRSKGNTAGETDGPGPNAPKRSGRKGRGSETDRGSGNAAKRRMKKEEFQSIEEKKDPCWDSHKQVGMKKKGGRMVPNCVPKEELELEGYKGKHGQSDKEYADSRSQGGKMISGDSKRSGAEYTHGRRVKAENPGMQPDVGGKTKPKSQGKMDKGTKADLEYRKANLKKKEQKEEVELQELDIKGAVSGALNKGSQFMKKNPVGRAVGNVLKPVGAGRGTARPSVRTLNTIRQNQQSQMNSFEPEGEMTEGILGGAGLIAGGLAAYKAIKGMQTVNKMKNDAKSGKGLAGRLQNRTNTINKALGNSFEPEGELVEGIRDKDPEKGTEERKKRLEKKRGHKVDDHPEYAKESVTPGQPAEKLKTGRKMFTIPDEERSAAAARLKEKARKKREEKMKEELEIKEGSCGSSKKKKKTYKEEAESKAQQRLMGLALSVKRGDTPMSSVTPQVARMAREMKEKDLKDFAGTKHDGLPEKVKKEEPEVSSPLVESLVESAVQRMVAKARRETAEAKRVDRQASSAQQRAELNAKK